MTSRTRRATGLIKLSPDATKSLSHQLADTVRRLIIDGIWIKDDKLPGSRTIADDARVSRNTVNAALEILISEGMLESRGRSGLYVTWRHASRGTKMEVAAKPEAIGRRPLSLDALPLDLFPLDVWKRLQTRYWSKASIASLDDEAPAGAAPLREAIAVLVNVTAGISCSADQVFIVSGLRDALMLIREVLLKQNPAALVEDPAHPNTLYAVRAVGMNAIPVAVDSQGMNIDLAIQAGNEAGIAIVRPAFQFPTGAMLSPARARNLRDWSKRADAIVLEDATESEFSFAKRAFRSLATFEAGTVAHFNTFNRSLFPSLGIGYLIAPERLVDAFSRARTNAEPNMSLSSQMVLANFIASGHFAKHVRKCRDIAAERHEALLANLEQLTPSLTLDRQFGGLHVCTHLASNARDTLVAERAISIGVDVAPLSALYSKKPVAQGLLFGFAAFDTQLIAQSVRALARILPAQTATPSTAG